MNAAECRENGLLTGALLHMVYDHETLGELNISFTVHSGRCDLCRMATRGYAKDFISVGDSFTIRSGQGIGVPTEFTDFAYSERLKDLMRASLTSFIERETSAIAGRAK